MEKKLIYIKDQNDLTSYDKELIKFKNLYLLGFPLKDEREPFNHIIDRIKDNAYPWTSIRLVIDDDKVVGWIIIDHYSDINTLHPIYMVVDKEYRKQWIWTYLLQNCTNWYDNIDHIYIECENPEKVKNEGITIDPSKRLKMYENLWFEIVPINYVQPPLGKWKWFDRNQLLLHKWKKLDKQNLKDFQYRFYRCLKYEHSDELTKIFNEIDNIIL